MSIVLLSRADVRLCTAVKLHLLVDLVNQTSGKKNDQVKRKNNKFPVVSEYSPIAESPTGAM